MTVSAGVSVCAEHLDFGFKPGSPVLRNVNLTVDHGERVALMGASGSGKTTLLKLMAGLQGYAPKAGICFRRGRLAMVFQQPLLLNHLSVHDNILLPARFQQTDQNIDDIVQILDLGKLLDRYPFQLSGGQQRRVALARAMACPDSQGLLMDEPFSGLDEPLRERILIELQAGLDATGLTCILSTHSPLEAAFLADRILFLGNTPASIIAEHVVHLPRGDRHRLLDKAEFFDEITLIRNTINELYGSLDAGELLEQDT